MGYPVIDPVGTGSNIRTLIRNSGNTITDIGRLLGLADMSTMYKWLRGDALPGIDNMLALSILLDVPINDILGQSNVTKHGSVVQMESMEASKPSDFGSYPNGSAIALWCNGNTSDSDSGIMVHLVREKRARTLFCEGCFGSLV